MISDLGDVETVLLEELDRLVLVLVLLDRLLECIAVLRLGGTLDASAAAVLVIDLSAQMARCDAQV